MTTPDNVTQKATHTRGPWRCEQDEHFGPGFSITAPGMGNRCPVVRMTSPYAEIDETLEADARLIAAAPDLLEALTGLLPQTFTGNPSRADEIAHWERERDLGNDQARHVLAAFAAIAKATGGTP